MQVIRVIFKSTIPQPSVGFHIDIKWLVLIRDALGDLLPFVLFIKREKHPWRSVKFSKVAGLSYGKEWKQKKT